MTLKEIKEARAAGASSEESLSSLDTYIAAHPEDDEALTERALLNWAMGKRSAAINDHLAAVRLNPKSRSGQALKAAYEILNFYNKDLYNP